MEIIFIPPLTEGSPLPPGEAQGEGSVCPPCGKPVTFGVMHRTEVLADHPVGYRAPKALPYWSPVPLEAIIAEVTDAMVRQTVERRTFKALDFA